MVVTYKMAYYCCYLLLVMLLACLVISGCAMINEQATLHSMGQFSYTLNSGNDKPAIRKIPIWIDNAFGEADKVEISDAIDAWNYALNGRIVLEVVDMHLVREKEPEKLLIQLKMNGWLILKTDSNNKIMPKDNGKYVIGFTNMIGGNYLYIVRERLFNIEVFGLTLHEIGHLLGAGHTGDKLMFPTFDRYRFQCIDYASLEAVAVYQGLNIKELNWCYLTY